MNERHHAGMQAGRQQCKCSQHATCSTADDMQQTMQLTPAQHAAQVLANLNYDDPKAILEAIAGIAQTRVPECRFFPAVPARKGRHVPHPCGPKLLLRDYCTPVPHAACCMAPCTCHAVRLASMKRRPSPGGRAGWTRRPCGAANESCRRVNGLPRLQRSTHPSGSTT
jgi:hypothetical protein